MKTLSQALLTLLTLAGMVATGTSQAEVTYYHHDALGSVVAATNESGTVLWREHYEPYGERLDRAVSTEEHSIYYTGKPHDDRTGLTYFGARHYDPVIGRFMGIDPAGVDPGNIHSFNRYAYANNNPYAYVDPDGREIVAVKNKKENGGTHYSISFTGHLTDKTGTFSQADLQGLAARMKTQIEETYSSGGITSWSTTVDITVGGAYDPSSGRHNITIENDTTFNDVQSRIGDVFGYAPEGSNEIRIHGKIAPFTPDKPHGEGYSFERTAAHEFGHSAGLDHWSGGIMYPTSITNARYSLKPQIEKIYNRNKQH